MMPTWYPVSSRSPKPDDIHISTGTSLAVDINLNQSKIGAYNMSMPVVLRFYNLHAGNGRRGIALRLQQTISSKRRKIKPTETLEQKSGE